MSYFCIVSKFDYPIYTCQFTHSAQQLNGKIDLLQFIANAAIDSSLVQLSKSPLMYQKNVDKFNDILVSTFFTASNDIFILLHTSALSDADSSDDRIKHFFTTVYSYYIKIQLSPLYEKRSRITSKLFDQRVNDAAKQYLKT